MITYCFTLRLFFKYTMGKCDVINHTQINWYINSYFKRSDYNQMNGQIIKKRLSDLKKLSGELQKSVQAEGYPNISLLKTIIDITKDHQKKPAQPTNLNRFPSLKPTLKSILDQNSPTLKERMKSTSNRQSATLQSFQSQQESNPHSVYQPLFPQNAVSNPQLDPEQSDQLINLRQQNLELEQKLKEVRKQLEEKCNDRPEVKQESRKPYFEYEENLAVFVTKLQVSGNDYHCIDYVGSKVRLTVDQIAVERSGGRRLKSDKAQTDDFNTQNAWQLHLDQLAAVQYLFPDTNHPGMLLQFKQDQSDSKSTVSLFISFQSPSNLHRWELAIYINYKMILSVDKTQIFMQEEGLHSPKHYEEKEVQTTNEDTDPKDRSSLNNVNSQEVNEFLYPDFQSDHRSHLSSSQKQSDHNKIPQEQQSIDKKILIEPVMTPQELLKEQQRQQEEQRQKIIEIQQKIKEEQRQKQKQQYQAALQWLKSGIFITKYAKGGIKAHEKRVYINNTATQLCWQEKDTKQAPKTINLSDIVKISQGEIGQGIQKHLNKSEMTNKRCFFVIHCNVGKDREIKEFGGKDEALVTELCNKLMLVLHQIRVTGKH